MKNAHLRFGWLTYVKSTEKTATSIRLHLDRLIAEMLPDPPRQAKAHLISVIGGDTQISAISSAISMADHFLIEGPGVAATRVCLERNARCFKGSLQLSERKKPLRHLIGISEELTSANLSPTAGKTVLAASHKDFVWASIAEIYGVPGIPEWADWFAGELTRHRASTRALGIGCDPIILNGTREQYLDWLSWALESGALRFPATNCGISWPAFSLERAFGLMGTRDTGPIQK